MANFAVISARVDKRVKALVSKWCKAHGLVMAKFVEDAILDKLEEAGDLAKIAALRREPTRPFREVMKELSALK